MDEAMSELQALSSKRSSLRDKLKKRREAIGSILAGSGLETTPTPAPATSAKVPPKVEDSTTTKASVSTDLKEKSQNGSGGKDTVKSPDTKKPRLGSSESVEDEATKDRTSAASVQPETKRKRTSTTSSDKEETAKSSNDDLLSLLQAQSAKEKADQQQRDEIRELLGTPTAKEQVLIDSFRSQTGGGVKEFCTHSTKQECMRANASKKPCSKLHFAKIIQPHTDESLGDCSFLNTCFHMDTCKYIHYEVDTDDIRKHKNNANSNLGSASAPGSNSEAVEAAGGRPTSIRVLSESEMKLVPPQWVQCDLRSLNLSFLGKFSILMADPPWDIHMELPYGTMSDDEMRNLPVQKLQDEGLIFLWVTGRAMELGR